MPIDDQGNVRFSAEVQQLLEQVRRATVDVADAMRTLEQAVFLEEIEDQLLALRNHADALRLAAVEARDAVQAEAAPEEEQS